MGGDGSFPEPAADTMLEFKLKVKCKHNFRAPKGSEDPKELYQHANGRGAVYIQVGFQYSDMLLYHFSDVW